MSVAELKNQAAALSFEELSELSRHLRALALQRNPNRPAQIHAVEESSAWLSRGEFEKALQQITALSPDERIDLIGELWDSLAGAPDFIPITEAQRIELDRRLAAHTANPNDVIPWDQVESELDARFRPRP